MGGDHNNVIAFSYFPINFPEWSISAQRSRATVKCPVSNKTVSANYVQALTATVVDLLTGVPTWTDLQFVFLFQIKSESVYKSFKLATSSIFNVLGNCISENFNLFQISMACMLKLFICLGCRGNEWDAQHKQFLMWNNFRSRLNVIK